MVMGAAPIAKLSQAILALLILLGALPAIKAVYVLVLKPYVQKSVVTATTITLMGVMMET